MLSVSTHGLLSQGRCGFVHHYPIRAYRLGDVLDCLLTLIVVVQRKFVLDMIVDRARDADTTGNREAFQSRGDVDPIAIESFTFHDHIAQIDANAKLHLPMFRQLGVLLFECVLNFHCAAHRIHHTGELG